MYSSNLFINGLNFPLGNGGLIHKKFSKALDVDRIDQSMNVS